jgi:hypothetical protein
MQYYEPRPTANIPRSYFLIVLDIAPPSDLYAAAVVIFIFQSMLSFKDANPNTPEFHIGRFYSQSLSR